MARITVVRSPFNDALNGRVESLDRTVMDEEDHERLIYEPCNEGICWGMNPEDYFELIQEIENEQAH